jgi:hypothetical protein
VLDAVDMIEKGKFGVPSFSVVPRSAPSTLSRPGPQWVLGAQRPREILAITMSQENVDRFLQATAAFNRIPAVGASGIPDYLRFMDAEVLFEPHQAVLQGSYVGLDGVKAWFADITQHYEDWHVHLDEVRDHEDRVLALGSLRVTGAGSGIEFEAPLAIVASFRDGLITHLQTPGPTVQDEQQR